MDLTAFAARLRELRTGAKLTQAELAKRAGLHLPSLRRWEQGKNEPTFGNVIALADALGLSCDDFRPDGVKGKKGSGRRG